MIHYGMNINREQKDVTPFRMKIIVTEMFVYN
jgi:hypothetical protein